MNSSSVHLFLFKFPTPLPNDVANFLRNFEYEDRLEAMLQLEAAGLNPDIIVAATTILAESPIRGGLQGGSSLGMGSSPWQLVVFASAMASGYHGFKRHGDSIAWGALWFILGGAIPVVPVGVALVQGYGKPKAD